jgi:hypothetical protein
MVVLLAACEAQGPKGLAPEANRGLDRGREAAARWIATGRGVDAPPDPAVLALGYLERLRLGLGSPFRLAEQALVDLRLPATDRTSLAWAILARTYDRESHEIEAAALDRIGSAPGAPARFAGALHLDLISGAIRESLDPRSGELAVRLAYALAAGEGTVERNAPEIATRAAALLRDRELARADVVQLLRAADRDNIDPLVLLVRWRAERRFAVEAPPPTGRNRSGSPASAAHPRASSRSGIGFAAVRFADGVPAEWRPYFRRMLESLCRTCSACCRRSTCAA